MFEDNKRPWRRSKGILILPKPLRKIFRNTLFERLPEDTKYRSNETSETKV